jgi:hypothetical protein
MALSSRLRNGCVLVPSHTSRPVRSISNNCYMMTIWDEATSFLWSYPVERNLDAYKVYVRWPAQLERETGKKVKKDCPHG